MSKKDRQRWRFALQNKATSNDIDKVKAITYQMELAITKLDQQNTQLRKGAILKQQEINNRVNQVHQYYGNILKKRGVSQNQKRFQQLNKKAQQLRINNQKLTQQLKDQTKKSIDALKLVKANEANINQYEQLLKKNKIELNQQIQNLKKQYQEKLKLGSKDIASVNQSLTRLKYQKDVQIKRINKAHDQQIKYLNQAHVKQINILKNQKTNLANKITTLNQAISEKQKELNNLVDTNIKIEKQLKILTDEKIKLESINERQKKDHQKKLNLQNSSHSKNIEKLQSQMKKAIQMKEKQVQNLKSKTQKQSQYSSELNEVIMNKDKQIKNLLGSISKKDVQISRLNQMISRKEKDIGKYTQIKDKHTNQITSLYQKMGQMMPLTEVQKIQNDHNKEIEKLQNQLWQLTDQITSMVPSDEMQKLQSKSQEERTKMGQDFQSAQGIIEQLKSRIQESDRHFKQTIAQIKQQKREEIAELNIQHEKKLIEIKNFQSQQNDKKQAKYSSTLSQIKEQLKSQYQKQLNRLKQQHKVSIETIYELKDKEANDFKNQIHMMKSKLTTLQKQIDLANGVISQQKEESLGKNREDQMAIVTLKAKIEQFEIKQKYLQENIKELEQNLKQASETLINKQRQYQKDRKELQQKLLFQLHQNQLNALKKDNDINTEFMKVKQTYETKILQIQKRQNNEKRYLTDKITMLENKINEKDKQIEQQRKQHAAYISEMIKSKDSVQQNQRNRQKKIQQGIQEIMKAKQKQFSKILKQIQDKNDSYLNQISTLQNSNSVLRNQLRASLDRANKEKQLYQEINRLKAQVSQYEKRNSPYLNVPSPKYNQQMLRTPSDYKNRLNRSSKYPSQTNLGYKEDLQPGQASMRSNQRYPTYSFKSREERVSQRERQYMTPKISLNKELGEKLRASEKADDTETERKFKANQLNQQNI